MGEENVDRALQNSACLANRVGVVRVQLLQDEEESTVLEGRQGAIRAVLPSPLL